MEEYKISKWIFILLPFLWIATIVPATFVVAIFVFLVRLSSFNINYPQFTQFFWILTGIVWLVFNLGIILKILKSKILLSSSELKIKSLFSEKCILWSSIKSYNSYEIQTGVRRGLFLVVPWGKQYWFEISYTDENGRDRHLKKSVTNYTDNQNLLARLKAKIPSRAVQRQNKNYKPDKVLWYLSLLSAVFGAVPLVLLTASSLLPNTLHNNLPILLAEYGTTYWVFVVFTQINWYYVIRGKDTSVRKPVDFVSKTAQYLTRLVPLLYVAFIFKAIYLDIDATPLMVEGRIQNIRTDRHSYIESAGSVLIQVSGESFTLTQYDYDSIYRNLNAQTTPIRVYYLPYSKTVIKIENVNTGQDLY